MSCGKKVFDKIVPVTNFEYDKEVDFHVDLSPALEDGTHIYVVTHSQAKLGLGQVGVIIVPSVKAHYPNYWHARPRVKVWLQVIHLYSSEIEII